MKENEKILNYVKILMKEFNAIIFIMLIAMALTYLAHPIFTVLFIIALGLLGYKIIKVNAFVNKLEDILKEETKIATKEDDLIKCRRELQKVSNEEILNQDTETIEEVSKPVTQTQEVVEEKEVTEVSKPVIEDIIKRKQVTIDTKEDIVEKEIEEVIETKQEVVVEEIKPIDKVIEEITEKNYVHNFDYVEEVDFVTTKEEIKEEPKEELKETISEEKPKEKEEKSKKQKATKKPVTKEEVVETKEEIDITKCIRKLPKGRKASEKAKALALSYGYELKEGETFVAPKK